MFMENATFALKKLMFIFITNQPAIAMTQKQKTPTEPCREMGRILSLNTYQMWNATICVLTTENTH